MSQERPAREVVFACLLIVFALTSKAVGQDIARGTQTPEGHPLVEQWQASGTRGAVVAGGAEATAAGLEILQGGGNAADAAAATILALSVTDARLFCFGGEVPILAYRADRGVAEVIAGQGVAPRLATREHFASREDGIPAQGIETASVPAVLDACLVLLERQGTRTFAEVVSPTLRILEREEQPWHADMRRTLQRLTAAEASHDDRSQALRRVADCFYRGEIAREIDAWSRDNGGLIRFADLATHVTRVEEPLTATYRGYTVVKCGPWTQGPTLLQALQILDGRPIEVGTKPVDISTIHESVEALKLALADRDAYYADPLYVDVPVHALLDPTYAAKRRGLLDPERASLELRPGDPLRGMAALGAEEAAQRLGIGPGGPSHDTTTCLVADGQGNVVAATPSGWSGVLAGQTGVWLGSRLQSFNITPGHPNVIEPGKRPRITLTPTLVLNSQGRPVIGVSVAGGDHQDQITLQLLRHLIDFDLSPAVAVTTPRFGTDHHVGSFRQTPPSLGSLEINPEVGDRTIEHLKEMGHRVKVNPRPIAAPVVLRIDPETGRIDAAGDPRTGRHAAAY